MPRQETMSVLGSDLQPPVVAPTLATAGHDGLEHEQDAPESGPERRRSGQRARRRDRLMDRATGSYPQSAGLRGIDNVENLLLFVDDDLRETALAITRIESYLLRTLGLLETRDLRRDQVLALANDVGVLEHLDMLNETIESLRRRLAKLCAAMR
jgi:hypothetical protein